MSEPRRSERAIRVAVVDDHPVVRAGIVAMLRRSGVCRVVGEATTASTARRLLPRSRPDVVILDLKLPDGGGPDLVGELRHLMPDCRVLVLTAFQELGMAREAFRLGASGYLLKGAPSETLVAAICQVSAGEEVVDAVLSGQLSEQSLPGHDLTERESQILRLLADGRSNKEIARLLEIAQDTVKFHLKNLFRRLHARTRTEAVVAATRLGYLHLEV